MLTPESYQMAWLAYIAATLAALVVLYLWVGPRMSRGGRLAWALVLGALALTPAHPATDIDTWAPAIFVTGFELLTNGTEAATRPLRSLLIALAMVLALCLLGWLALRGRGKALETEPQPEPQPEPGAGAPPANP